MSMTRREFLQALAVASASGFYLSGCDKGADQTAKSGAAGQPSNPYELPKFGNVSFLHYTDCHAQLNPVYFREPSVNLGIGSMRGNPPHLVGEYFLKHYNIQAGTRDAHAFTYIDFTELAHKYGQLGGFAHLATLVKNIKAQRPGSLLLDGGDTWQGSGTALWTDAQDMVDAQIQLGVDVMTAHWEFTYGSQRVKDILDTQLKGKIDFVAQNVFDNTWGDRVFEPFTMREINGVPCAIIGQAFPYTPIANPRWMIPDWSFGIHPDSMQKVVDQARSKGAQVVVVLSHNGMDVDLKMASHVTGIDAICGGHTHDAVPTAVEVTNAGGKTLVTNAGSNAKFLGVLDFDVKNGKVAGYKYHLLPVFSNLIEPDKDMQALIDRVHNTEIEYEGQKFTPKDKYAEQLATTSDLLYRRGNFNGTFDQVICDGLMQEMDAEIALSPGFRWGVSVLPGEAITMEHVMTQTAITYPTAYRREMSGQQIKAVLEDVADNLFNDDPYDQQGGDMVRTGGLGYSITPANKIGSRINDMTLKGKPIDPNKNYVVAGWAVVGEELKGTPVWDVVANHLRNIKEVKSVEPNVPVIKGQDGNPGMPASA
jgi:S-sulfosulfanyl-L-cysteine sulfohydrolase